MTKTQLIPIIIDVDTGTDDAICLASAIMSQDQLEIVGFTSVCGNVTIEKTSQNTLNVVTYASSTAPVLVGAEAPLVRALAPAISHGATGLGDVVLPTAQTPFHPGTPADFIHEAAVAHGGKLQILAVGPLTNVALAILQYPDLRGLIEKITIMGGGIQGGNMTLAAEFNIFNDPEAARIVFESGIPVTMVGLDVTLKPQLPDWVVEKIKESPGTAAEIVTLVLDFMCRRKVEIGGDDPNLHDVIALAAIVAPEVLSYTDHYVHVDLGEGVTRGATLADFHKVSGHTPNAKVATDIDIDAFWQWFANLFIAGESQQ